jgi:hypothetical protein
MLIFAEGGKPENPEKNPQRESTTNSTHIWHRVRELNWVTVVRGGHYASHAFHEEYTMYNVIKFLIYVWIVALFLL